MTNNRTDRDPFLCQHEAPRGTFWATELENATTSLDPTETPPSIQPIRTFDELSEAEQLCASFRHSGWEPTRRRIYESFNRTGHSHAVVHRYARCGQHAWVYRSLEDEDRYRVRGSFCRSRWCRPCQLQRSRLIAANLSELVAGKRARFVTLTIAHSDQPLADQLQKLQSGLTKLRASTWWKQRVWAGVWFLEITYNHQRQQWHPHLHLLVQGLYIKQSELKHRWWTVTGDSYIVHIEFVRSEEHCHKYVTKYSSKALGVTPAMPDRKLDELIVTMRGKRLCGTFGRWKNANLLQQQVDDTIWQYVGRLDEILLNAKNGNDQARAIIESLNTPRTEEQAVEPINRAPPQDALTHAIPADRWQDLPYLED